MFNGKKIKELRESKGLDVNTLVHEIYAKQGQRISSVTIRNWEKGSFEPKITQIKKVADFFGVSLDYFMS